MDLPLWILAAGVPLGMVIGTKSAPAIVVVAALAGLGLAGRDRTLAPARPPAPAAIALFVFIVIAAASALFVSHRPGPSLLHWLEAVVPLAAVGVLAALRRDQPPPDMRVLALLLASAIALAAAVILADLASGMRLRRALGLRVDTFIYNRGAVTLVLLLPVLAALVIAAGRARALVGLSAIAGALAALAAFRSDSGAAVLALAAMAIAVPLALWRARLGLWLGLCCALALLALAPFIGPLLERAIPDGWHQALASTSSSARVRIWTAFGAMAGAAPLLGHGFGASLALGSAPAAIAVAADLRPMLDVGHPHNAFLQVWVELGTLGALLIAALFALGARAAAAWRAAVLGPLVVAAAGVGAVALVSHGAWQAWWLALIGVLILLLQAARGMANDDGQR